MGRAAALVLSLFALALLTGLGIWIIFAVATRARAAYRRYKGLP